MQKDWQNIYGIANPSLFLQAVRCWFLLCKIRYCTSKAILIGVGAESRFSHEKHAKAKR
jgi:hypothetical protein